MRTKTLSLVASLIGSMFLVGCGDYGYDYPAGVGVAYYDSPVYYDPGYPYYYGHYWHDGRWWRDRDDWRDHHGEWQARVERDRARGDFHAEHAGHYQQPEHHDGSERHWH